MRMKLFLIVLIFLVSSILIGRVDVVFAEEPKESEVYGKEGLYVGLAIPYHHINKSKDFDGLSYFSDGYDVGIVPKLESDFAFQAILGGKYHQRAIELTYEKAKYSGTWAGESVDSKLRIFNIVAKWYVNNERIQPYILCGIGAIKFEIDSSDLGYSDLDDSEFSGSNVKVGAGFAYYLTKRLSIQTDIDYNYISLSKVYFESGDEYKLADFPNQGIVDINMSLIYMFVPE